MPELPEVEFVRRELTLNVAGKRIAEARLLRQGLAPETTPEDFARRLSGRIISDILRRGKYLVFCFTGKQLLAVHLRMTGKFTLLDNYNELPKHTHAIFNLSGRRILAFSDQRHFGRMILANGESPSTIDEIASLGPEPFPETFSFLDFLTALRRSRRSIKDFLLDQTKVSGLGNIYAAEALFRARIHPAVIANKIGSVRGRRLHQAIIKTIADALESLPGAAEFSIGTKTDSYTNRSEPNWLIYGREGEPCLTCGAIIRSIRQSGRTTCFCPTCQKR